MLRFIFKELWVTVIMLAVTFILTPFVTKEILISLWGFTAFTFVARVCGKMN